MAWVSYVLLEPGVGGGFLGSCVGVIWLCNVMHTHAYIYIYIYIYMHAYTQSFLGVFTFVCMHVCMCVYVFLSSASHPIKGRFEPP